MTAEFTEDIKRAAKVVAAGGVIICPSEGVYGISCSFKNEDAIGRIIRIKERDALKGLIVVDASAEYLDSYIAKDAVDAYSQKLMQRMWPGPHTFILKARENFSSQALRPDNSMAVRITAFKPLSELCKEAKVPLISTSANISGRPATSSIDELDSVLLERVDLVLNLPCGGQLAPTSIYDTRNHTLVRKGPSWKE